MHSIQWCFREGPREARFVCLFVYLESLEVAGVHRIMARLLGNGVSRQCRGGGVKNDSSGMTDCQNRKKKKKTEMFSFFCFKETLFHCEVPQDIWSHKQLTLAVRFSFFNILFKESAAQDWEEKYKLDLFPAFQRRAVSFSPRCTTCRNLSSDLLWASESLSLTTKSWSRGIHSNNKILRRPLCFINKTSDLLDYSRGDVP